MRIVIVGAGLVGLNIAHALLDEGCAVTLIDPDDQPSRPSVGNAGSIAHTDILPLASPKVWRHLPRWLLDPLGPLAIRPSYAPRLLPWLLRFLIASRPGQIEASTVALRELNALALPAWRRRLERLGLAGHLRERGGLSVFADEAAFRAAGALVERQRAFDIPVEVLDGAGVRRLEPALGSVVAGGIHYPTWCHVSDPRVLTAALEASVRERGATVVAAKAVVVRTTAEGVEVATDRAGSITADRVVIAAGIWSRPLAAGLGEPVPLDTERGYNATYPPGTFGLTRPVTYEGFGFVTSPLDTGDRVGGAVEFAGIEAPANHARTDAILKRLRGFLPGFDPAAREAVRWMGFRPSLPDSLPVIGASRKAPNVLYAFGHGHYGLTQSAATADLITALVLGRATAIDLAPFKVDRF